MKVEVVVWDVSDENDSSFEIIKKNIDTIVGQIHTYSDQDAKNNPHILVTPFSSEYSMYSIFLNINSS